MGSKYYIIGRNDKILRQSSFMHIYDVETNNLEQIKIEKKGRYLLFINASTDYYKEKNEIILFGGYSEGNMLNTIYRFNIESKEINKIESSGDVNNIPLPRTGHSSFIYENNLYIFGGSIKDGTLLNDFWKLNLESRSWEKILLKNDNNKQENSNNDPSNENSNENNNNENSNNENRNNENDSSTYYYYLPQDLDIL